jgi:hypothetical protein
MGNSLEKKPERSPAEDSQRENANEPSARLTPILPFDVGEQVVGSRHRFAVGFPVNLSRFGGAASVKVAGDPAFVASGMPKLFMPRDATSPIEVRYQPMEAGEHKTKLLLQAQWEDGHVENQTAVITGRARHVDDVPSTSEPAESENSNVHNAPLDPNETVTESELAVTDELEKAGIHANALLLAQWAAVATIESAQGTFAKAHADPSIWLDLAEFALSLATAGIGSFIEHAVAGKVASLMTHEARAVAEGAIEAAEKEVPLAAETVGKLAGDGLKHVVEHGPEIVEHVEVVGGEREKKEQDSESQTDFFEHQKQTLNEAAVAAGEQIVDLAPTLRSMSKRNPTAAVGVAKAITAGFADARKVAGPLQHAATASQFVAYKARVSLGQEQVATPEGVRTATNLDGTRQYQEAGMKPPVNGDGLLDIQVEIDGDSVRVSGARVTGISQEVADYLLEVDLASSHMTIRFVTNGYGFITRDELGRIRASDYWRPFDSDGAISDLEAQRLRGAERVARIVMSKTMHSWGVKRVETDDAAGKGE